MILADYEEEGGYRDFRPRYPKRQRLPPVVLLCKDMMPDIKTMGESAKAFSEDIKFLSEAIVHEYGNDEYFNNAFLKTLRSVILEQPHKAPGIALLTMVVNSGKAEIGKSIINYFFEELHGFIHSSYDPNFEVSSHETGPWNKVKLILRFFSLLSPIITPDDLFELYKKMIQFAVDLNNSSEKRSPLSEAIYTNTILNIPYLFFFQSANTESLRNLVEELVSFIESEYKVKDVDISLLKEYNKNAPYESVHWVAAVLPNVKNALANDMDEIKQLFPDYNSLLTEQSVNHSFNDPLNLPTLEQITPFAGLDKGLGSVDSLWKTPRYSFEVYLPNVAGPFSTVIPVSQYAGMLFEDILIDIIESMEFNRHEVARQVVTVDLFFKSGIFTEPGLSVSQLVDQYESNPMTSTFKIEDLSVGTILALTFKLPTVTQSFAYFYSLLVEICQNSPKAIAPVFGRAFRHFYSNLDKLDLELKVRFLDWFSIQMSNFNFSWKWNEWEVDSIQWGQTIYNPRLVFIKNLIRKELRLTSNSSDVEESVTDEFQQYTDPSFISKQHLADYYQSLFKNFEVDVTELRNNELLFRSPTFPLNEEVTKLLDFFHKQPNMRTVEELEGILSGLCESHNSIIEDPKRFTVTLLIQTIVFCGSRSLSHANKYIEDSKSELKEILSKVDIAKETIDKWVVEAVMRYWNSNSQTGYLILDSLRYSGLISNQSIVQFSLTEQYGANLGLIDSTSIESTFRILTELALSQDKNVELFELVLGALTNIATEVINNLGAIEPIIAPDLESDLQPDNSELPKLDLVWKYETTMGFIKSLLRKYSDEYMLVPEAFKSQLLQNVQHEPTKQQLNIWMTEISEL